MESTIDLIELKKVIADEKVVLAYFSHDACGVCQILKPKISQAVKVKYPNIRQIYVNIEHAPKAAGQFSIFTAPVVLVFFGGEEHIRMARSFGVGELLNAIERPYGMMMG